MCAGQKIRLDALKQNLQKVQNLKLLSIKTNLLLIFLFVLVVQIMGLKISTATPPAIAKHAVNWKPIKEVAFKFSPQTAMTFVKIVERSLRPASREFGNKGLYKAHHIEEELRNFIRPYLVSDQIDKVKHLFEVITLNRWIVGWHSSRKFSGNTFVSPKLEIRNNREYQVTYWDMVADNPRKRPVFGLSFATGVRVLPIYSLKDKFIFENVNMFKLRNTTWGDRQGSERPVGFLIDKPHLIKEIATRHWPYKEGVPIGSISLRSAKRKIVGTWQCKPLPHFAGYNSVCWLCRPEIILQPGSYVITDSDPDSWANNQASGLRGMSWVIGEPVN